MSDKGSRSGLLVHCLVQEHRHLDMVLAGFLELGISKAWVSEVQGMGQVLSVDVPIFAGLRSLFPGATGEGHLVTAAIPADMEDAVAALVEDICGPWDREGAATLVAVPLLSHRGALLPFGDS